MPPTHDDLTQQSILKQLEAAGLDQSLPDDIQNALNRLRGLRDEYTEQAGHINGNGDFSPQGKQTRLATLAQTSSENARRAADTLLESLAKRIRDEDIRLSEITNPNSDRTVRELRNIEIRRHLADKSDVEIQSMVINAGIAGDREFLDAVRTSPIQLLADLAPLEAATRAAAEQVNPDSAGNRRRLMSLQSTLQNALSATLTHCGDNRSDPVRRVAEGQAA